MKTVSLWISPVVVATVMGLSGCADASRALDNVGDWFKDRPADAGRQAAPAAPTKTEEPVVRPVAADGDEVITNETILAMTQAGLSESVILTKIQASATRFDLRSGALVELKRAGVTNRVLEAMVSAGTGKSGKSASGPGERPGVTAPKASRSTPSGSSDKPAAPARDTAGGLESSGGFGQPGSAISAVQGQASTEMNPQKVAVRYDLAFDAAAKAAEELGYTPQVRDRRNGRLSFVRLGSSTVPALALEVLFLKRSDGGRDVKVTAQLASPPIDTGLSAFLAHMTRTALIPEINDHPAAIRRAIESAVNQ